MDFVYYVQEYAKKRAESILPVPERYPLRGNFGVDFYSSFSELTTILKKIYLDVSENPAAYECELYPLDDEPRGKDCADNESNLSLDRIVKCLRVLCDCGEIEDNTLKVKTEHFKKQIKKVKKSSAIIDNLKDFGFLFQGDIFDKDTHHFYLSYPAKPNIINVLKIYMDCWNDVINDEYLKGEIKKYGYGWIAGYYDFYLLDYKATANPQELNPMQTVKDRCYALDKDSADIYINFYEYSKKYPTIHFFGDYFIGKKRIAIFRYSDKIGFLKLKLKLKNPDKYIPEIEKLPERLQACFSDKVIKCSRCGCLGNNPETCNNRILWTLKNVDYIGCSMQSFYFSDIKNEDIPRLFTLIECEYSIKKSD